MMIRAWRVFAALILIMAMRSERAHACVCAMSGPPCQATWSADAVFTGVVRAIETIDHPQLGGPYQSRRVRFDVERGLRGIAAGQADVGTGTGGGDCGYRFEVGKRYLVYAWRREGAGLTRATHPSRTGRPTPLRKMPARSAS